MWFGTNDGLNKYDGCTFTVYKYIPGNNKSINSNSISSIYEDSNKNLWIGTLNGLNRYDRMKDQFVQKDEWPKKNVFTFVSDKDESFYISSMRGLSRYNPQNDGFDFFSHAGLDTNNLNNNHISDFIVDDYGNIWVGTIDGLNLIDHHNNQIYHFRNEYKNDKSLGGNLIQTLCLDSHGRVWAGTNNNGLNLMKYDEKDPQKSVFVKYLYKSKRNMNKIDGAILTLREDSRGYLWIGTNSDGLYILDLNQFQEESPLFHHYLHDPSKENSISKSPVQPIYEDRHKNIWIGTMNDGLNVYSIFTNQFIHYKNDRHAISSLSDNMVKVFYRQNENLWIGTANGLNLFDISNDSFKGFFFNPENDKSLSSNNISAILKDSKDNLWIGTWGGGLNLFNPEDDTFVRYSLDHQNDNLSTDDISAILEDREGNLWICIIGGGLIRFDNKMQSSIKFVHDSDNEQSLSNNWVRTLFETSFGELWISTDSAIDLFDKENQTFVHFTHDSSDAMNINFKRARVFFEDSRQNLWIGSQGGLNLFNREDSTFRFYYEKHGLPNNQIKGILEDDHGHLWISSNKGISKFIQGIEKPENPVFKNYDVGDGLQGSEFVEKSCIKTDDGMMYFGGSNGFNVFHPDSLKENPYRPDVVITQMFISNKPVEVGVAGSPLQSHISMTKELNLSYKHSVITFEYAALNYIIPEKNQYAFILEGFENEWNYVAQKRSATYTNLDPGEYTFRVKAANNDGLWNEEGVALSIKIRPPWWQTVWAYAGYILIVLVLFSSIWRFQLNKERMKNQLKLEHEHAEKLEQINRMKTRFFSNITHEFRTPLTLIIGLIQNLISQDKNKPNEKDYHTILKNSHKLYQLINQLLDLSKLEAGAMPLKARRENLTPFLSDIIVLFQPLADRKNIRIQFTVQNIVDPESDQVELYFDGQKLEKIIANLLSNAIKFTEDGGTVHVTLKKLENDVEIIFEDTGVGIASNEIDDVFKRFHQIDDTYTRKNEGTGIGLALVKELLEIHHGTIEVSSEVNEGTTFVVRLPSGKDHLKPEEVVDDVIAKATETQLFKPVLDIADEKSQNKSDIDSGTLHQKKLPMILIVEDNQDLRKYLKTSLAKEYQILLSNDGRQGLEKTFSIIPDLIISDVMMPGMDGFELCKQIKNDERTNHIPVILLTSRAAGESKIEGLETGADDYMTKPFEMEELKVRIKNLIEQRNTLRLRYNRITGLRPEEIAANSMDEAFLKKALTLLEANYSESSFNAGQFAVEIGISRTHLNRKLQALTGQTIRDFIRAFRLNRAAQLLEKNSGTVLEIGYSVGFESISYFCTAFQKKFGTSPSNYRKKMSAKSDK